jgi:hypothetical protein
MFFQLVICEPDPNADGEEAVADIAHCKAERRSRLATVE